MDCYKQVEVWIHHTKPWINVQSAEVGAKLSTSKSGLRKVLDGQNPGKSSDTVATGPCIEDQVDEKDHKFLNSKTALLCLENNNSGLGVRFSKMCTDSTESHCMHHKFLQLYMTINVDAGQKDFNGYFIKIL